LSMGDLRRLELARALATNPKLLLLDEVFAGLTVGEIAELTELLKEKKEEGLTFIIVSHDLRSLATLVDRVVVVSFGRLIAEGSFKEVIADEKVQEAYLGKQHSQI
jgi:branched-chain amino acid transport system ATP-binding protein